MHTICVFVRMHIAYRSILLVGLVPTLILFACSSKQSNAVSPQNLSFPNHVTLSASSSHKVKTSTIFSGTHEKKRRQTSVIMSKTPSKNKTVLAFRKNVSNRVTEKSHVGVSSQQRSLSASRTEFLQRIDALKITDDSLASRFDALKVAHDELIYRLEEQKTVFEGSLSSLKNEISKTTETFNDKIVALKKESDMALASVEAATSSRILKVICFATAIAILTLALIIWVCIMHRRRATVSGGGIKSTFGGVSSSDVLAEKISLIESLAARTTSLENALAEGLAKEAEVLDRVVMSIKAVGQVGSAAPCPEIIDLITAIANRLAFMEVTLYRMDSSVKGYRQLTRSIEQIHSNLLANGFEIVKMLGMPYSDGMHLVASFIDDENLARGTQIITGITKPQINYNGKTIQTAQVTVSQNI